MSRSIAFNVLYSYEPTCVVYYLHRCIPAIWFPLPVSNLSSSNSAQTSQMAKRHWAIPDVDRSRAIMMEPETRVRSRRSKTSILGQRPGAKEL